MDQLRTMILAKFGKRAKHKWSTAALDFHLVDLGMKPACLFDHWALSSEEMQNFTMDLHKQGLTNNKINVLSIGQDVLIYSSKCGKRFLANCTALKCFIDASSTLLNPTLADDEKVWNTTSIFTKLCGIMNDICIRQDFTCVYDVEISDRLNGPCLFGLLLGYPCVYWYDVTNGDEHCLSGQVLHLFVVKGHLRTSTVEEKSARLEGFKETLLQKSGSINGDSARPERIYTKPNSSDKIHVIFSFTVPVNLLASVKDHVKNWYVQWKDSTLWYHMFCDVWLEEDNVSPQSVCL